MERPFFEPWVGSNWGTSPGLPIRLLILGEAHYNLNGTVPGPAFTRQVIEEDGMAGPNPFFTKVAKAVTGLDMLNDADRRAFWHSVAFHNFVQGSVGNGPRQAPSAEMWLEAGPPFLQVLQDLKPDAVLVLGYRTWDYLPDTGRNGPDLPPLRETYLYPIEAGAEILAAPISHPSTAFSPPEYHLHVRRLIEAAAFAQK